jgi:hypothetical protein
MKTEIPDRVLVILLTGLQGLMGAMWNQGFFA